MKVLSIILVGWLVFTTANKAEYQDWINVNCNSHYTPPQFFTSGANSYIWYTAVCWQEK